jgi:hypothetical protein
MEYHFGAMLVEDRVEGRNVLDVAHDEIALIE